MTRTHSVGFLWTRDRPVAENSTRQHTTRTIDRHPCPRRDWNPTIPANERPHTHRAPSGNWIVYLCGVFCLKTVRIEYLYFNEIGCTLWPDEPTFDLWAFHNRNVWKDRMCEIPIQSSFIKTRKAWLYCNVAVCVVLDVFDLPCPIGLYICRPIWNATMAFWRLYPGTDILNVQRWKCTRYDLAVLAAVPKRRYLSIIYANYLPERIQA